MRRSGTKWCPPPRFVDVYLYSPCLDPTALNDTVRDTALLGTSIAIKYLTWE